MISNNLFIGYGVSYFPYSKIEVTIIGNRFEDTNTAINSAIRSESRLNIIDNDFSNTHEGVQIDLRKGGVPSVKLEGNNISSTIPINIIGSTDVEVDLGGGSLGSSGENVIKGETLLQDNRPSYSGTVYAKNNIWKDSTGSEVQPPEELEGPADTEHFYIKNTGNKIRFSGTEDTTPPSVTIDTAPSGTIERRDVTFEWSGSDDRTATSDLVYSYILDGHDTSWSDWSSNASKTYTDLPDGSYTFKVEAKDEAGNITGTPSTASFTVDLAEPNLSFTTEGWKMIGFPYSVDWSKASFSDPSSFVNDGVGNVRLVVWDSNDQQYLNHYSDSSYVTSAWKGYWIKVSSASSENPATITVNETSKSPSASGLRTALPASVKNKKLEYPPLPDGAENSEPIKVATYSSQKGDSITFTVLNAESGIKELDVSVFDSSGQKIWQGGGKGKELSWSTEGVPNGIYLYKTSLKVGDQRREFGFSKLLLIK